MDRGVEGAKPPPAAVSWDDKSSSGFGHEASGSNFTLIYSAFSRFNSGFSRFNLLPDRVQDNGNAQTLFNSDQTLLNSDKRRATISSCNRLQDEVPSASQAASGGMQELPLLRSLTGGIRLTRKASQSIWAREVRVGREAESKHWQEYEEFRHEEIRRAGVNSGAQLSKTFFSHCWRKVNPLEGTHSEGQKKKRRLMAHLSTPQDCGGPGLAYWADFLDLQAEGPVMWRHEIETAVHQCAKMVCFVDEAWLTSFNCLQELAFAIQCKKPVAVVVLDQESWDLLTLPNGAETAWSMDRWGVPLKEHDGKELVAGQGDEWRLSLRMVQRLFEFLASINMCPARPLEEVNLGVHAMMKQVERYVMKDMIYSKEFAELQLLTTKFNESGNRADLLLNRKLADDWDRWLLVAEGSGSKPEPTQEMWDYVRASLQRSTTRRRQLRMLQVLLMTLIALGGICSGVMAWVAEEQAGQARKSQRKAMAALVQAQDAEAASRMAQLEAEAQRLEADILREQAEAQRAEADVLRAEADMQRRKAEAGIQLLVPLLAGGVDKTSMTAIKTVVAPSDDGNCTYPSYIPEIDLKKNELTEEMLSVLGDVLAPCTTAKGQLVHNPFLVKLDLERCSLGDSGVIQLASYLSPRQDSAGVWVWPPITELRLIKNSISEEGVAALSEALAPRQDAGGNWSWAPLETLVINANTIGVGGAQALAAALLAPSGSRHNFNPNFKTLSMNHCGLGDEGAAAVATALMPQRDPETEQWVVSMIRNLNIYRNDLTDASAEVLAEALAPRQNPDGGWVFNSLRSISVHRNGIGDAGGAMLVDALVSPRLFDPPEGSGEPRWESASNIHQVNMADNDIGDLTAAAFADALRPRLVPGGQGSKGAWTGGGLTILSLATTRITGEGVDILLGALVPRPVEGTEDPTQQLVNLKLKSLYFEESDFQDPAAVDVATQAAVEMIVAARSKLQEDPAALEVLILEKTPQLPGAP